MANRELNVILGLKLTEFAAGLNKAEKQLKRFGENMARTGRELTQNLTLPILGVGAGAIAAFRDIDKLERGLIAIMGSSEAAAAEMIKLREVAKLPGLGFKEAIEGSIRLQAVELTADEARETLMAFGTAIAATGGTAQNLESVQYQLTQMITKNRILLQDFRIMQENVPLLSKAMQAAFGTQNLDQIQKSGISAKEFNRQIVIALQNLPETQNVTSGLNNAFENFGDNVKIAAAELGRSINRAIDLEGILNKLSDAINRLVERFNSLTPQQQKFIVYSAGILAAVGPVIFVIGKLASMLSMASGALATLSKFLGASGGAMLRFVGPVGFAVGLFLKMYQNSERLRNSIGPLFGAFGNLGSSIIKLGKSLNDIIPKIPILNKGFEKLGDALAIVIEGWTNLINGVAELDLKKIGAGFLDIIGTGAARKAFVDGKTFGDSLGKGIKEGFLQTEITQQGLLQMAGFAQGQGVVQNIGPTTTNPFGKTPTTKTPLPPDEDANKTLSTYEKLLETFKGLDNVGKEFGQSTLDILRAKLEEAGNAFDDALLSNEKKEDVDKIRATIDQIRNSISATGALKPIQPIDTINLANGNLLLESIKEKRKDDILLMGEQIKLNERQKEQLQTLEEFRQKELETLSNQQKIFDTIKNSLGSIFDAAFQAIEKGANVFKAITQSIKQVVLELAKAALKAAIFAAILALIPGGSGVGKILGGLGQNVGKGSFGGNFLKFFADGGLVQGPTLAMIGEGIGTSRNNPEVVAPLDKLRSILDSSMGGGQFVASTRLQGSDLLLVVERAERNRGR